MYCPLTSPELLSTRLLLIQQQNVLFLPNRRARRNLSCQCEYSSRVFAEPAKREEEKL